MNTTAATTASKAALAIAMVAAVPADVAAAPEGYPHAQGVLVTETSGADLAGYPVKVVVDTTAWVAAGEMRADAADVVFTLGDAPSCGVDVLPHWLEGGADSATTTFWVRLPTLPASSTQTLGMYFGNPADVEASTDADAALAVFAHDAGPDDVAMPGPFLGYSAMQLLVEGAAGGVTNSQRGFRFTPNKDVIVLGLGKREPSGTTRTVTLFDVATQTVLRQQQVSGPAGMLSGAAIAPIWLRAGTTYVVALYQGDTDGYYVHPTNQLAPDFVYEDMRYCNACTQDTFPQNALADVLYGFPDLAYFRGPPAGSPPSVALVDGPCAMSTTCDADCSAVSCGDGTVNDAADEGCDDANDASDDDCIACALAICGDGHVWTGVEACDDGNDDDTDACPSTCAIATCGDGAVHAGVEECDDGNLDDGDGCDADCRASPACDEAGCDDDDDQASDGDAGGCACRGGGRGGAYSAGALLVVALAAMASRGRRRRARPVR